MITTLLFKNGFRCHGQTMIRIKWNSTPNFTLLFHWSIHCHLSSLNIPLIQFEMILEEVFRENFVISIDFSVNRCQENRSMFCGWMVNLYENQSIRGDKNEFILRKNRLIWVKMKVSRSLLRIIHWPMIDRWMTKQNRREILCLTSIVFSNDIVSSSSSILCGGRRHFHQISFWTNLYNSRLGFSFLHTDKFNWIFNQKK